MSCWKSTLHFSLSKVYIFLLKSEIKDIGAVFKKIVSHWNYVFWLFPPFLLTIEQCKRHKEDKKKEFKKICRLLTAFNFILFTPFHKPPAR